MGNGGNHYKSGNKDNCGGHKTCVNVINHDNRGSKSHVSNIGTSASLVTVVSLAAEVAI
jgi:hypothetical protein